MCGYCTESIVFPLLLNPLHPQKEKILLNSSHFCAYLQENPLSSNVLTQLTETMSRNSFIRLIVACKGLETLAQLGYESYEYQALLADERYISGINNFCDLIRQQHPQAASLSQSISMMPWLADSQLFTKHSEFESRFKHLNLRLTTHLLEHYQATCLQQTNAMFALPAEEAKSTENDSINQGNRQEWENLGFPYLWLSLLWLARNHPTHPAIWELVHNDLLAPPPFSSFGLWLQHKATLITYDEQGINPFLKELSQIRPELFQYLAVQKRVGSNDLIMLTTQLEKLPNGDHQGEHFSLRSWAVDGDLQLPY